ncbi:MAG: IS4 family transposase [Caldilineaceae bacterium]|nr:IS4 family transposase [Caldilineaceae bacterium]
MTKKTASTVRHTRSNQVARGQKQPSPPPDEVTEQRIREVVHPATLAQAEYYQQLGLRERTLTLPVMVAIVISLVWRQFASVNEALRMLKTEGLLWADPLQVTQQALSERLRTLPANLFWHVLQDVLPVMLGKWQERTRPLPAEITWALTQYERVWAVDGSTLDALMRRVGLLRDLPKHPLAGRMMGLLDVTSRLPVHLWYEEDDQAHDQRFWDQILDVLLPDTLLLLDLGFTNYEYYARLMAAQVVFISRCKSNAAYRVTKILHKSANLTDSLIVLGEKQMPMRLVEMQYKGKWYRYLTSELDAERLSPVYVVALYWQRWRIEDAYKTVKRLLGLAYFWVGSSNGVALQLWATWLMYSVLVDLTDDVADSLAVPFNQMSMEMVYRSLYFCTMAFHRGEADDPVLYLAQNASLFGLVKRKRKPDTLHLLNLTILEQP